MDRTHSLEPSYTLAYLFTLAAFVSACGNPSSPEGRASSPSEPDEQPSQEEAALERARNAADQLATNLRSRLIAAMQESGPAGAVDVCSREAGQITARAGAQFDTRVGRASLRMRSDADAPGWVRTWLEQNDGKSAAHVSGFERIEDGHARVLRPLAIQGPCLNCHGSNLAPEVAAAIEERYPADQATGYELGDLRGALYAESAID